MGDKQNQSEKQESSTCWFWSCCTWRFCRAALALAALPGLWLQRRVAAVASAHQLLPLVTLDFSDLDAAPAGLAALWEHQETGSVSQRSRRSHGRDVTEQPVTWDQEVLNHLEQGLWKQDELVSGFLVCSQLLSGNSLNTPDSSPAQITWRCCRPRPHVALH